MTRHPLVTGDAEQIKQALLRILREKLALDPHEASSKDWLRALIELTRQVLASRWVETRGRAAKEGAKAVYYLSIEFLPGRSLESHLVNLGTNTACAKALREFGVDLESLYDLEFEAALGNGGLGRLAACFMEGLTTHDYAAWGYGIRYVFGMFRQRIQKGWQVEQPEIWLREGDLWEFPRYEVAYPIRFGGDVSEYRDPAGELRSHWAYTDDIEAVAFDLPVSGFGAETVNSIRLWAARATREFDLGYFNGGDYAGAVRDKNESENLSRVLYPDDSTAVGRELRLKQEYFFVSASLQDILARHAGPLERLHERVAIQLNDTHPALAIAELMRILIDLHELDWDTAWRVTTRTFSYTNHTLLPEALETWPVPLLERLLPRHLQIIFKINERFLKLATLREPQNPELIRRVSLISEDGEKHVRMAHLAIVGSHLVNGVSQLHAELMRTTVFADFNQLFPGRILAKTNGVTPRRWLRVANPELSSLITRSIGPGWETRIEQRLEDLLPLADDPGFLEEFRAIKRLRKQHLVEQLMKRMRVEADPSGLFDMQIKRIHEYKRQLLNILGVIARYNRIRFRHGLEPVPRTVLFAGKAAPSYHMAKLIIHLINSVGAVIAADPRVGNRLRVIFVPNYDVSTAEDLIPAADLSEQISTAGAEASGTGNMKLALNGALTIGTRDGANIEIGEAVGEENIFFFGLESSEVKQLRDSEAYDPMRCYEEQPELKQALDMVRDGYFSPRGPPINFGRSSIR